MNAAPSASATSARPVGGSAARGGQRPKGGAGAAPVTAPRGSWGAETWIALGVVIIVALLIVPLPAPVLDAMLALSLALSIVVLLVTLTTKDPIEFSIFPSLLLLLTLLRLGLNVSSTRLILSQGHAGRVIDAFGGFVIGGNFVVGLVIFLILVVINFAVITKGAGRIAEVAARFTLDAMPGKQMAIDADLSAGLIDETEARQRRQEIARYADFYGAMDGAAKFVRGDAVAGLVITAINLVGGFVVGMAQAGLSASEALSRYTTLTVGDGLVTQIPALIVSTAAGIIVTYSAKGPSVGPAIASQLTRSPRAIWMAAIVLGALAVVPGLPSLPFLLLAGAAAGAATRSQSRQRRAEQEAAQPAQTETGAPAPAPVRDLLHVETLELEIGYALVPLVDQSQQGDLLTRIGIMRKQAAMELGIIVPPTRIRDNIQLPANHYAVRLRGVRVAQGEVHPRYLLALDTTGGLPPVEGIQTRDPSYGLPAVWIVPERRAEAEAAGYSVVEPPTVLATHLMETIRRHAGELLSRQETRELLDGLKETHPALVDDVIPQKLSLGTVHRVLQRLLKEGVPIRDLVTVLEVLSDAAETSRDPEQLTEHVRRALAPVIADLFSDADGAVRGITVGPRLEGALMTLFTPSPKRDAAASMDPTQLTTALRSLRDAVESARHDGRTRPLITPPALRVGIRRLVEPVVPNLAVISLAELPANTPVNSLVTWELPRAA